MRLSTQYYMQIVNCQVKYKTGQDFIINSYILHPISLYIPFPCNHNKKRSIAKRNKIHYNIIK